MDTNRFLNGFLCAVPTARRDAYRPRSAPCKETHHDPIQKHRLPLVRQRR